MIRLRDELLKLQTGPIQRHRRIVRAGRRLLLVSWWTDMPSVIRGSVIPLLPWHFDERSDDFPVQTINRFKINHVGTEWVTAEVQNISVVDSRQRRGWGRNLVEALITAFPQYRWRVSAPNEKSTALFVDLHARHPNSVVHPDDREH